MSSAVAKEEEEQELTGEEIFWRDHYVWLSEAGYALRPRYKPDWKPSWIGARKHPFDCEDGIFLIVRPNVSTTHTIPQYRRTSTVRLLMRFARPMGPSLR